MIATIFSGIAIGIAVAAIVLNRKNEKRLDQAREDELRHRREEQGE